MSRLKQTNGLVVLAVLATLAAGSASARPEIGGDYASSPLLTFIDSTSSTNPTLLTSVQIRCPVAGFLIVQADAEFMLYQSSSTARGELHYGITRTTAVDSNHYHRVEGDSGTLRVVRNGAMQRFETCLAGQTLTYRLVAYRYLNLTSPTWARRAQISVIHVRDRY